MSSKKIHAQPPKKLTGIELEKIPSSATGFTAIKSAITHIKEEVGLKYLMKISIIIIIAFVFLHNILIKILYLIQMQA